MVGFDMRWKTAIALMVVVMVTDGHAKRLLVTDGVELHGTVRLVARGAATCNVEEAREPEEKYERIKENDGKPLDVWRLDFSVYNGSGKPLSYMAAYFNIASEWPPCTNWSGPSGSYSKHVSWAGSYEVLQKPSGMAPGEEVRDVAFLLVFHEQRPSFESWDVKFNFGKPTRVPSPAAPAASRPSKAPAASGPARQPPPRPSVAPAAPEPGRPSRISADQTCAGKPEGDACWKELANHPQCYVWDSYLYTDWDRGMDWRVFGWLCPGDGNAHMGQG